MAQRRARTQRRRGPQQTLIQRSRAVPPSEKATFHQLTGAGRRGVLRPFFGLSATDEAAITDRVAAHLDQITRNANGRQ